MFAIISSLGLKGYCLWLLFTACRGVGGGFGFGGYDGGYTPSEKTAKDGISYVVVAGSVCGVPL